MRRGKCYRLPPWVAVMSASGFGLLADGVTIDSESPWATPTVNCNNNRKGISKKAGDGLATQVKAASAMAWPTPTAHAARNPSPNEKNRDGLSFAVSRGVGKGNRSVFGSAWPTPTCTDVKYAIHGNTQRSKCLGAMARRGEMDFPTPRCRDLCGGTGSHDKLKNLAAVGILDAEEARALGAKVETYDTPTTQGDGGSGRKGNMPVFGQLNPDWVEWLMNWPFGWTDPDADALVWVAPEHDPADLDGDHPLYIPRITTRKEYRIKRIVTLGNGQVPLCALAAEIWGFEILSAIAEF